MDASTWVALAAALAATAAATIALWQTHAARSQAASALRQAESAERQAASAYRQAASAERQTALLEDQLKLIQQSMITEYDRHVSQDLLLQKSLAADLIGKAHALGQFADAVTVHVKRGVMTSFVDSQHLLLTKGSISDWAACYAQIQQNVANEAVLAAARQVDERLSGFGRAVDQYFSTGWKRENKSKKERFRAAVFGWQEALWKAVDDYDKMVRSWTS